MKWGGRTVAEKLKKTLVHCYRGNYIYAEWERLPRVELIFGLSIAIENKLALVSDVV